MTKTNQTPLDARAASVLEDLDRYHAARTRPASLYSDAAACIRHYQHLAGPPPTHAVVMMLYETDLGTPEQCVVQFVSEAEAYQWVADLLVSRGELKALDAGRYAFDLDGLGEEVCSCPADAVHMWGYCLAGTEYLHVVPIRDAAELLTTKPAKSTKEGEVPL